MMRLELVDKYGLTNYYYSVLGVVCDEQNNLHIMKDGYTYFVSNSQYRSYGLFTEKEDERVAICLNACEGITSEALENGVIKEAMELFWRVSDKAILNENNQMTHKGNIVFASDKEVE